MLLGHLERPAQQRLGGGGPEAHDHLRPHDLELGLEPRPARRHLGRVGLGVDPDLAAGPRGRLPLEVLDRVGHVGLRPVDAGLREAVVEHPSGRPDEGPPREVLLVAGLLADEHHLGPGGTLAEDGLGAELVEIAGRARGGQRSELVQSTHVTSLPTRR